MTAGPPCCMLLLLMPVVMFGFFYFWAHGCAWMKDTPVQKRRAHLLAGLCGILLASFGGLVFKFLSEPDVPYPKHQVIAPLVYRICALVVASSFGLAALFFLVKSTLGIGYFPASSPGDCQNALKRTESRRAGSAATPKNEV